MDPASRPLSDHTGCELILRPDLEIREISQDGSTYHVIKDPIRGRFFRVKPLELFLIRQFDGKTTFDELRHRASQNKKVLVGEPVLRSFAAKFVALGLLRDRENNVLPSIGAPARNFWNLKKPLANPEALLETLYPWFRPLFSASFVILSVVAMLIALAIVVLNSEQLSFGFASVLTTEGFLFALMTVAGVTCIHELAHGLTCRHYGGRVTDMGFMLVYFLPCFYCNVSDTYFFQNKRHRLWVLFSGGFIELVIWAASVIIWRLVDPTSLVARLAFVIIGVSAIRSLFNFNPLIKMDGYYMLSDLLSVQNLRREALAGVAGRARALFGLPRPPLSEDIQGRRWLNLSAERWLGLFGIASIAYSVALFGYLGWISTDFVFHRFGAEGLGLFSLVLVGLLRKPVVAAAQEAQNVTKEKWQELKTPRRRFSFAFVWLFLLIVVALCPWNLRVSSELTVLPSTQQSVRSPASGRIAQIMVSEGQRVEPGALILELDERDLILERDTKLAELARAQEELRLLAKQNPTAKEEIRIKQRELETARAREQTARRDFERQEQLMNLELTPKTTYDQARHLLNEALSEVREAEAAIALANKSSPDARGEQMERLHLRDPEAQRAVIQRLESELAQLEERLTRTKVYAAIGGIVTTYRVEEKLGEFLEEGSLICEIMDDRRVVVEMPISEKDIDIVQLGREVQFKVRGYPSRRFHGAVDEIADVAREHEDAMTILVRAHVDNEDKVLKPGMTGVAKIYCGLSIVAKVFSRDLVRFIRTEFWL